MMKFYKYFFAIGLCLICLGDGRSQSSHKTAKNIVTGASWTLALTDTISKIAAEYPAEIGVAVIIDNTDTVTVNNECIYPMMSVFKVHQALAICNDFDNNGLSLDSIVNIRREELNPHTWSPMMKDYPEAVISLPVKELLRYTLIQSDNNASNYMFNNLVSIAETDRFIASIIPRQSFRILYTEEEMFSDHDKAYDNCTSPLGAAILMNRLFTDSLVNYDKQGFIMKTLEQCLTGKDRIIAPLIGKEDVTFAHKTGSGFINKHGALAAHNDVAFIRLSDNTTYTLAVFVKDFMGNENQAAKAISRISETVYSFLKQTP